jgi:hypothetical protein
VRVFLHPVKQFDLLGVLHVNSPVVNMSVST